MPLNKDSLDQLRIERTSEEAREGRGWLVFLVLFMLVMGAGGYWWYHQARRLPVHTTEARETKIQDHRTVLNASGYVTARREATVSSKVTGKIVEVLVEEGMAAEEGQVLARLDDSNVVANLKLAEAKLVVARTALAETRVRLHEAGLELQRVSALTAQQVATQASLDAAQAEVDSCKARLDRQTEEIKVAEQQIALWRQECEDRTIRAPFPGIVVSKDAQPGEMISPVSAGGGFTRTGICTLVDMSSLEIEVDVNESFINRVQPNQPVEARLDAYPDWTIPCQVIAIVPTADREKATVRVRIGFESLDPRILPDMGVKVAFLETVQEIEAGSSMVLIPKTAVRQDAGQDILFVVNQDRAERRVVSLGPEIEGNLAVQNGLTAGERVIIQAPAGLTDGVRVVEKP